MKASELRLGNLITSDGEIFTIDEIRNDFVNAGALGIYPAGFDCDLGIPLTPEWLKKFGFESEYTVSCDNMDISGGTSFQNSGDEIEQIITKDGRFFFVRDQSASDFDGSTEYSYTELQYVHQLQNLYFALTGQELTIKEHASHETI